MLRSRRYRRQQFGSSEQRPRGALRLIIGALVLLILWYLGNRVFSLFDDSVGRGSSAILSMENPVDATQVSLQGGDWQRGEQSLKLYTGDAVATRATGHAVLTFFDGSRMRLDQSTELRINKILRGNGKQSEFSVEVRSGRLSLATPNLAIFTGAILRRVETASYIADIPSDVSALLSADVVTVLRSSGLGLNIQLKNVRAGNASQIYVGEGQTLALSEDSRRQIAGGADPYTFRDPLTADTLKDEFLTKSYAQLSTLVLTLPSATSGGSGAIATPTDGQDLVLSAPGNRAKVTGNAVTVSGNVSQRIRNVLVNGYDAPIKPNRSFSLELALSPTEETTLVQVKAQDPQGITLAEENRTVIRELKPFEPVRMKSPVASGATLTTAQQEIEITGEAPNGTAGIVVNDYKLQLFKPGARTWSYLASTRIGNLQLGKNVFTIYALDENGRRSTPTTITIIVDPTAGAASSAGGTASATSQPPLKQNPPLLPGTLKVTGPVAGTAAEITESEVLLEGTTSPDTASISVNGYTLSLYVAGKTTWNYIASTELTTLKEGKNVYRVVSRNADGEILDVLEYTMTYAK